MTASDADQVWLTADDYGRSAATNAAILALADAGRIGAVSVMAHRAADLSEVRALAATGVALGLHLCFTDGRPLVPAVGDALSPGYAPLFAELTARPWRVAPLREEADAQAARLLDAGVAITFVNAHEHVHLFPPLWTVTATLARRLGVRAVRAALGQRLAPSRAGLVAAASRFAWARAPLPGTMVMSPLGVARAGALTASAIDVLLACPFDASDGVVRELCLHPALDEPGRRAEHALLASGEVERIALRRGLRVAHGPSLTSARPRH